jgi:hypothetical protein
MAGLLDPFSPPAPAEKHAAFEAAAKRGVSAYEMIRQALARELQAA